jgi:SP family general alpha glucoside:H+ symporter-like MFS transporter
MCFAPETPWHLARDNQLEGALKSYRRTLRAGSIIDVKAKITEIQGTNNLEMEQSAGTTYKDCFKGIDRRRTFIGCLAFIGNCLSGTPFAYHRAYFLRQIGIPQQQVYNIHVSGAALSLVSAVFCWLCLMPYVGRRKIYLWGMSSMSAILLIIGILQIGSPNKGVQRAWVQASLTLVWTFIQQCTAGPMSWCIPAEIGSTRLRSKTIAISRNAYYIVQITAYAIQPFFLNGAKLDMKGFTGFIWCGSAFIFFVVAFFCLPETKDRSYEDLDYLFENRVASREFMTYGIHRGVNQAEVLNTSV